VNYFPKLTSNLIHQHVESGHDPGGLPRPAHGRLGEREVRGKTGLARALRGFSPIPMPFFGSPCKIEREEIAICYTQVPQRSP
jgi:hypothetical protein